MTDAEQVGKIIPVNFQWKRSAYRSEVVPTTFGSEALKQVPASEVRPCELALLSTILFVIFLLSSVN